MSTGIFKYYTLEVTYHMGDKKSNGAGRTRSYACVVYPESAPATWLQILADQKVPCLVSPLHDQDLNPTGEPKKPHYHVQLCFEGPKSADQAQAIFDQIGGVGCERVNSLRGMARYLCHLDNPEKHQYNPSDVRQFCGADYKTFIGLASDKYVAIGEMIDFAEANNIVSFADLVEYARVYHFDSWFRILCDNGAYVMDKYLKSRAWQMGVLGGSDQRKRGSDAGQ